MSLIRPIITNLIDDLVTPVISSDVTSSEPELIHWWDFHDTSTLTLGGGGEISLAANKVGSIDLQQTTMSLQPLSGTQSYGGFDYAEFGNGGSTYLNFVGGDIDLEDTTIFVVCVTTDVSGRQVLIGAAPSVHSVCDLVNTTPNMRVAGGNPYWEDGGSGGFSASSFALSLNTVSVCGWVLDTSGPVTFFLNASEDTGATSDGSGEVLRGRIGAWFNGARPLVGSIREVKIFNTTDLVRVRELRDNLVNRTP